MTRYGRFLGALVTLVLLAPADAVAQPIDFTMLDYYRTQAWIENATGWYDDVNYGAAEAGHWGKRNYIPDGVNLGSYLVYLTVGAGTTYDDNIYLQSKDATADFRSEGTASLALISQLPRHMFNVYLDGTYVNYAEHEENNYLDGSARAEWRIDIDHGHALGGRVSSTYDHEDRNSPETPPEAREAVPVLTNEAEVALTRDQGRLALNAGFDFADYDYSDVEAFDGSRIDQDFRDMTSYGAFLRLNHRFSPGYRLLASVRAGREIYHGAEAEFRNATVYEGKLGLGFELSPLWRANVSAGYGVADYDFDANDRFGAFVYDGELQWLTSPVLTMTLSAGQSIDRASFGDEGAILETHAELKAAYEAMRNLMLTATAGFEHADIGRDGRQDDTYFGKIGAEYTINKNLLFTIGYEHEERFSTVSDFDSEVNRYTVGLKIRF